MPPDKTHRHRSAALRAAALLFAVYLTSGCQTFNLTKEEFETQQRGKSVDPETGNIVAAVGAAGYLGAAIGTAVAGNSR